MLTEYERLLREKATPVYDAFNRAETECRQAGQALLAEARKTMTEDGRTNPDKLRGAVATFEGECKAAGKRLLATLTGNTGEGAPKDSAAYKYLQTAGRMSKRHAFALLRLYGEAPPKVKNLAAGDFDRNYDGNAWGVWRNIENVRQRDVGGFVEAVKNAVNRGVKVATTIGAVIRRQLRLAVELASMPSLEDMVNAWQMNPAYVRDTIEAHHRAVYRRGVVEIGELAGLALWRMYASPISDDEAHTEQDAANIGRILTRAEWEDLGYDISQFGSHHGSRSTWWPIPAVVARQEE
jgi:hypothetical protein